MPTLFDTTLKRALRKDSRPANTSSDSLNASILGDFIESNLIGIYQQSFRDNFELPCLTDYSTGHTLTYGDFARNIARLHLLFDKSGIRKGDKIALMGKNTISWVTVFFATLTYGAIIVPILAEFNPRDAENIINHSDSKLIFVGEKEFEALMMGNLPKISAALCLDTHRVLAVNAEKDATLQQWEARVQTIDADMTQKYTNGFSAADIRYPLLDAENIALINYTSGTTGFSKGVMLRLRNLWGNVMFGIRSKLHYKGSRALAFLPLAHAYGCAFDLLVPMAVGTHVTLLGVLPSPTVLLKAFASVRPSLVICVPLILEKIYKRQILPTLSKKTVHTILSVPGLDKLIYRSIRKRLIKAFGGCFEEVIVGGAPLNPEVEAFLLKIGFPLTVGYGMTECAPLISYTPWRKFIGSSAGHVLDGFMTARIDSDDPANTPGEILVRGTNVMAGYYKNTEITNETIDADGWLHTGDVGTLGGDDGKTLFIRGRSKTMILTATGQNIYPEEIEAKLNNMPYVAESLVVERDGRITALIFPDSETLAQANIPDSEVPRLMEDVRQKVNRLVAPYEQVQRVELVDKEFEKAPKRSIKRFLYT